MGEAFGGSYMYWVGMNTTTDDLDALKEYHDFYRIHLAEVVEKNPNFLRGYRYELLDQDGRWPIGPQWLAVYEIANGEGAQGYLDRHDGLRGGRFKDFTPTPDVWNDSTEWVWQLMWRRTADSGPPAPGCDTVVMVATDRGGSDALVADDADVARTTRYEIVRTIRHPPPGCPPMLAVHEIGPSRSAATHVADAPNGWRLVYRRLAT
jgi:hypothetical protein